MADKKSKENISPKNEATQDDVTAAEKDKILKFREKMLALKLEREKSCHLAS